jgi:hypothetical protein
MGPLSSRPLRTTAPMTFYFGSETMDASPAGATNMQVAIEIENIERLRHDEGIDDVELRTGIRALRVGDLVRLTLLAGRSAAEAILVQLTRIRGLEFRGKLVTKPLSRSLSELEVGQALAFGSAHIHSIPPSKRRT